MLPSSCFFKTSFRYFPYFGHSNQVFVLGHPEELNAHKPKAHCLWPHQVQSGRCLRTGQSSSLASPDGRQARADSTKTSSHIKFESLGEEFQSGFSRLLPLILGVVSQRHRVSFVQLLASGALIHNFLTSKMDSTSNNPPWDTSRSHEPEISIRKWKHVCKQIQRWAKR